MPYYMPQEQYDLEMTMWDEMNRRRHHEWMGTPVNDHAEKAMRTFANPGGGALQSILSGGTNDPEPSPRQWRQALNQHIDPSYGTPPGQQGNSWTDVLQKVGQEKLPNYPQAPNNVAKGGYQPPPLGGAPSITSTGAAYHDNQGLWDSLNSSANQQAWNRMQPQLQGQQVMAQFNHGLEMERLLAQIQGNKDIASLGMGRGLGQESKADLKNPNMPAGQRAIAKQEAVRTGALTQQEADAQESQTEYNKWAWADPQMTQVAPFRQVLEKMAGVNRTPYPIELQALHRIAREQSISESDLQSIIHDTLVNHGVGRLETPFGTAGTTPSTGGLDDIADGLRAIFTSPGVAYNKFIGIKPGDVPSNRVAGAQFLKAMQNEAARRQFAKQYGVQLP